jgi:hypothetical protein
MPWRRELRRTAETGNTEFGRLWSEMGDVAGDVIAVGLSVIGVEENGAASESGFDGVERCFRLSCG